MTDLRRSEASSSCLYLEHPCYALRVKPKHEKSVQHLLTHRGYPALVPVQRARRNYAGRHRDVELPIFPGYVFTRLDIQDRLPVLQTSGVLHILGSGKEFIPLEETEVQSLERLMESKLEMLPYSFVKVGDRVRIAEGPLKSAEGVVEVSADATYFVVNVSLLQRGIAVKIDRRWIRPLGR